MSGDFINIVQVCIESLLGFLWRDVSDGAVQAFSVLPVDPFQGIPFDPANGFPWAAEGDDFSFEQTNGAFGQPIVVWIAHAATGRVDPGFSQPFSVFYGNFMARYCRPRSE